MPWSFLACCFIAPEPARVAIIGGGIGGAATSHYLQRFLAAQRLPKASITAFERESHVGGRLQEVHFSSQNALVEIGGAAWTNVNHYMFELAAAAHVNITTSPAPSALGASLSQARIGVWDGSSITPFVPMALRNALSDIRTLVAELDFLGSINSNYAKQKSEAPFRNLSTFLGWGGIGKYTSKSIEELLVSAGVSAELIRDFAVPLTRTIYNRNGDANSFAMLASLAAELSQHHVVGGNSRLVQALFDLEAPELRLALNTSVARIALRSTPQSTPEFELFAPASAEAVASASGPESLGRFDAVVIAAPIERSEIAFENMTLPAGAMRDRGFTDWHVTLVEARDLDMTQFGPRDALDTAKQPWACKGNCYILTTANGTVPATPYVCLQPLGKHGMPSQSAGIFMVYSDRPLDASLIDRLFVDVRTTFAHHWLYTFASLVPMRDGGASAQPVVLHPAGLINANAVESIASAMEISVIGARNAARLVAEITSARVV